MPTRQSPQTSLAVFWMRGRACPDTAMQRSMRGASALLRRAAPTGAVGSCRSSSTTIAATLVRRQDAAAAQQPRSFSGRCVVASAPAPVAARRLTTGWPAAAAAAATVEHAAVSDDTAPVAPPLVELPTSDESESLLRIRHTSAHVLAMAVQRLFPKAQVTIGPWIENGFYYDFDYETPFSDKDLKRIQKEMYKIIREDLPLRREEVSREEARARITALGEPYKLEILDGIRGDAPITIYHIGDKWWDLCAGPHVASTGALDGDALELEAVAGAYWRGDETKAQLQRIYGTAWESAAQLEAYKARAEAAKARDHRVLGKQLNLFSIQEDAGGGLVFWHPPGAAVRHALETFWKEMHLAGGYSLVYSPHVAKLDLWKTSGHANFYSDSMFAPIIVEEEEYQLKPMNCPGHVLMYKDGFWSYRDLPLRWAELGTVYRYERSGTMHGLFRVRGFTQDDAHIFCLEHQIADEIRGVLDLTEQTLSTFGFSAYEINLSTRPEKSVGSDEIWEKAETALRAALDSKGWAYKIDVGGGAFYGPKIDLKIKDALGRKWQCSTVQVDFNLPERFDMEYTDADGTRKRPIMIHRALLGSLERFFGVLIEHYAGAFPLWLAPVQVRLLPVSDELADYTAEAAAALRKAGLRMEVLSRASIAKMIRDATRAKTPIMCVVGAREKESRSLSVRTYADGEVGSLPLEEVIQRAVRQNAERKGKF